MKNNANTQSRNIDLDMVNNCAKTQSTCKETSRPFEAGESGT